MNGIITVFLINERIENVEVLVSLFLFFDPSPVWGEKKTVSEACLKWPFVLLMPCLASFLESVLPLPKCLHINACPRIIWPHRNIHPHPVSDVGPVPPVMQAATGAFTNIKSTSRSFTYLRLHSPIGEKLFLYVNHRREVTSEKMSSFSKEKSQGYQMIILLFMYVCVLCIQTCKCTVLFS